MLKNISVVIIAVVLVVMGFSASRADAWEPLGYPYLVWGELSRSEIDGLKFDGSVEQGIDLIHILGSKWIFNVFTGIRATESDQHQDVWNNKITPFVGAKAKLNLGLPVGHWGQVAVGVRVEQVLYHAPQARDATQVVGFVSFGFGGDWKKK